jgi:hypothetical protein
MMDAGDAVEAVAEYAALKECPEEARGPWLKKEITQAISKLAGAEQIDSERQSVLFVPLFRGLTDNPIEWWNLLDEAERLLIERRYERMHGRQIVTDKNDDALKKQIADSVLREPGYPSEDDEALAKEIEELRLKAGYPDELDRYFEVLRQNGLSLKLAGTTLDDARGIFEKWDFSNDSSGQHPTTVRVRFWHDTRALDWLGILYSGNKIKERTRGQTLEQLEIQLKLWAGVRIGCGKPM